MGQQNGTNDSRTDEVELLDTLGASDRVSYGIAWTRCEDPISVTGTVIDVRYNTKGEAELVVNADPDDEMGLLKTNTDGGYTHVLARFGADEVHVHRPDNDNPNVSHLVGSTQQTLSSADV